MYVITNISDSTIKLQGGHWTSNLTDGYNRIKEMGEERIHSQQYYYMGKTAGSTASIGLGIHQTILGAYTGASLISGGITIGAGGSIGSFGLATVPAIAVSVPAVMGGVASVGVAAMGGTSVYFSIGQFRDNLEKAIEESKKASSEGAGNWTSGIRATQEVIPGTNVPKSFVMEGKFVNGNEVWVHGNATEHIGEYINSANGSILVENEIMQSFKTAVNKVLSKPLNPGKNFFSNVGGWEIGINADTGVIYHALMK